MEKKRGATAKALIGLVNDLTDTELLALTASENRPAIKNVLQNPQTITGGLARKESSFGLVGITVAKKFVVAGDCFERNGIEVGMNFEELFFGKVENSDGLETILAYQAVPEKKHDAFMYGTVLAKLTKRKAEVSIAEICAVIERQNNCEEEVFLKKCGINGFFSRDTRGKLHVVIVNWERWRWLMSAGRPTSNNCFIEGDRVFYRHSHF